MNKISAKNYKEEIKNAIGLFWDTKHKQTEGRKKIDQGRRSSVTGGKHLDGFAQLLVEIAKDIGIPNKCIYTKESVLPGYFRPTKKWDLVIINQGQQLITAIELKSQVGSFGNNFNNRIEEALGNAIDLWTAYREKGFPQTTPPWLGYLMIVEKSEKSTRIVSIKEPLYPVRKEFVDTSYLDRYKLLCQKLMLEKHYDAASVIWTKKNKEYGHIDEDLSIYTFLDSYIGFLLGKLHKF